MRLTPFTKTYFTTDMRHFDLKVGNRATTLSMLTIAVVTLLIAFINFFNFFVALIPKRIRSINTQKILGAQGYSLRAGIFFEAVSLLLIALLVSLLLVNLVEKSFFRELLSVSLFAPENMNVALLVVGVGILLAVFTASYPAWYLTSFAPAFVLKGNFGATTKGKALRNALIGMQFVLSFVFIIIAVFVAVQNSFMKNHDMGFDRDCILQYPVYNVYPQGSINSEQRQTLRNALLTSPYIEAVTFSEREIVGNTKSGWGREWSSGDKNIQFRVLPVEPGFLKTMGIAVTEGIDSNGDEATSNTKQPPCVSHGTLVITFIYRQDNLPCVKRKSPLSRFTMCVTNRYLYGVCFLCKVWSEVNGELLTASRQTHRQGIYNR